MLCICILLKAGLGAEEKEELVVFLSILSYLADMLLSPEFAALEAEDFSFLSDQSTTMSSSALLDYQYADENAMSAPPKRVTFTPTPVKPQPRAWERKPSTPFARRSEAQKIWKRFPLQNVTSSVNALWRKANTNGDGIMRPVKRLRTGAAGEADDKENVDYVAAKWDTEASPGKGHFHKIPATLQEEVPRPEAGSSDEDPPSAIEAADGQPERVETTPDLSERSVLREGSPVSVESEVALDSAQTLEGQSRLSSSDDSRAATEQLLDEADVFLRMPPQTPATISLPAGIGITHSPFQPSTTEPNETMSPALDLSRFGHQNQSPDIQLSFEVGKEESPQQQLLPAVAYVDPDDTSYLQDFLLRSRAQKAARVQPEQPVNGETKETEPNSACEIVSSTTNAADELSPPSSPIAESKNEVDADGDTDAKASSPCRRSSRLTRLPRPQKPSTTLPSSIALRRLNGSEFIAMQREAQSLAVTTRGNTRKNRGPGIAVRARLLQLRSDAESEADSSTEEQKEQKKAGRRVSWAEILARYQEFDGSPLSSSPDEEAPQQAPAAAAEPQEVAASSEQKKSSKRVRRMRQENVGSVNGTPAPKRSIEILLEDASRTTGQSVSSMTQQTGKRTRSRTKS